MVYINVRSIISVMRSLISNHNPWWSGKEDYTIKVWESQRIRWVPDWIRDVSLEPFSLNFVMGPRQVGKTTGIKLLIRELLEKVQPESVFYFNCDLTPDVEGLKRVLDTYLEFRRSEGIDSSLLFLDEITSVREWWRVIKGYVDLGLFRNDVITVTGSSSLRLSGYVELFPGRRGRGRDIHVLPLSFREFLKVHGVDVRLTGNLDRDLKGALRYEDEIRRLFSLYELKGGFPLSINDDPMAGEYLLKALEGEVLRARRSVELVKGVVSSILRKSPSPLSFSTIGRDVGVSYKTVQDYVEVLKNLFVLDYALYREDGRILWRKERKFYFLDPFIARTLSLWCGERYLESAFYEWVVQSHLARRYGSVFYFRNSYEIDCIAGDLRIEVKIGKPHRKYPRKVLILDREVLPTFLSVIA